MKEKIASKSSLSKNPFSHFQQTQRQGKTQKQQQARLCLQRVEALLAARANLTDIILCCRMLAQLYQEGLQSSGEFIEKSHEKAIHYYKKALLQGDIYDKHSSLIALRLLLEEKDQEWLKIRKQYENLPNDQATITQRIQLKCLLANMQSPDRPTQHPESTLLKSIDLGSKDKQASIAFFYQSLFNASIPLIHSKSQLNLKV